MNNTEEQKYINVKLTYPNNKDYDYLSMLEIIDMDAEAKKDIETGEGFLISAPANTIKKDIKNINGIYSTRFGQKFGDVSPFANRYSCACGETTGRVNNGIECQECHTIVKYVDDNFHLFGWIILKDQYHIIHPKFFDTLNIIMGESQFNIERKRMKVGKDKKKIEKNYRLKNIINYSPEIDQDGTPHECEFKPDNEPFYGIGMMEFYERFDEIIAYYEKLYPKKKEYFDEIKANRDKVFIHSIPVFTTHLRPMDIRGGELVFDPVNGYYNMINKHAHNINKDTRRMDRNITVKNSELYKLQMKYMELCEEILNTLSTKHGILRNLISGKNLPSVDNTLPSTLMLGNLD